MQEADYARIRDWILYLENDLCNPPDGKGAVRAVGRRRDAFRRVVVRWAGVEPDRFACFLTGEWTRRALAESGRFSHDAPGTGPVPGVDVLTVDSEISKERMPVFELRHGLHDGPFGRYFLAIAGGRVCALQFLDGRPSGAALAEIRKTWGRPVCIEDPEGTRAVADRIFPPPGTAPGPSPGVVLRGTGFQLRVWEAILRVPPGCVVSYEEVAARIGAPRAVRAVGSALARNPVAFLVPCHRVIRKNGAFGRYGGGDLRKKAMIAWEAAQRERSGGRAGFAPLPV